MYRTMAAGTLVAAAILLAGCGESLPSATSSGNPVISQAALTAPTPTASPVTTPAPPTPAPSATVGALPSWVVTGSMRDFRDFPGTTTLLADGSVLVAGGHGDGTRHDPASQGAELYDPDTGQWAQTGRMVAAHRSGATATLLPNGHVLVAGGSAYLGKGGGPSPRGDAEVYDPTTGTWAKTGSMTVARSSHIATLLPDGTVLVVGGYGPNFKPVKRAEIYDPSTGTWARTRSQPSRPASLAALATATVISNGRVLLVGSTHKSRVASVQEYDPASRTWRLIDSGPHCSSRAVRLRDGRVLVLCGSVFDEQDESASVFDPVSGSWTATAAPARWFRNAVLLADGRVLVADIGAGELYDPIGGTWTTAALPTYPDSRLAGFRMTGSNDTEWYEADTATLLRDGRVLLTIGPAALLYDPNEQAK
jgi:Galactose oxidase, central domain